MAMANDQRSEIVDEPVKKITRRDVLWLGVLGVGSILTCVHIWARRRAISRNPLGITEIAIEGPFEEYSSFTPQDLGRKFSNKKIADFKLFHLSLQEGKYYDEVFVTFTFTGKQDPNRKMKISLTVYGTEGSVIGETAGVFRDPRIVAGEVRNSGFSTGTKYEFPPVASVSTRLAMGKNASHISRIAIFAIEV
jgi:hypothetical protein